MTAWRLSAPPRLAVAGALTMAGQFAPVIVGATLTGQKETEGTTTVTAALSVATAGLNLVCIDAVRTGIRQTPALNNGNSYGAVITEQAYGPDFPQYDIELRGLAGAAGGSNHSSSMTKSGGATEEATHVLVAVSGGTVIEGTSINRASQSGVATHTSASYDVGGSLPALVLAFASGTGFSVGSTVQDLQMASSGWSDITGSVNGSGGVLKFVHSGVSAPNGHIPLRGWAKVHQPGTGYTWQVTPDFQPSAGQAEGVVMLTIVIR